MSILLLVVVVLYCTIGQTVSQELSWDWINSFEPSKRLSIKKKEQETWFSEKGGVWEYQGIPWEFPGNTKLSVNSNAMLILMQ